jgi:outer membrane protein OmpA-like peptidoglycan-associated protein
MIEKKILDPDGKLARDKPRYKHTDGGWISLTPAEPSPAQPVDGGAPSVAKASSAVSEASPAQSAGGNPRYQAAVNALRDRMDRAGVFLKTHRTPLIAGVAGVVIGVASALGISRWKESDPEADSHAKAMTERMLLENPLLKCRGSGNVATCIADTIEGKAALLAAELKKDPTLGCPDGVKGEECTSRALDDISFHGGAAVSPQAVRERDAERLSKSSSTPAAGKTSETAEAGANSENPQSGRTTPLININLGAVAPPATSPAPLSLFEQLNVAASQNILFEHDSAKLSPAGEKILREIGLKTQAVFQSGQDVCLQVRGFASEPGETDYNLDLSGMRAREVSRFLIGEFNIPANNIHPPMQDDLRHNIQHIHLGEQNRGVGEKYDRIVTVRIEEGPCNGL